MTPTTDRQLFRETVAAVAERARAILPQAVNGRVEKAVTLVLQGDVEPQSDGSVVVCSATDATRRYVLQGTSCTCADYERGQAPDGWCAHRIAAGVLKRVQELLPVQGDNCHLETPPPAASVAPEPLYEAPCSANVRLTIGGREVQLTLRDHDEARLLVRLEEVLQRYPVVPPGNTKGMNTSGATADTGQDGWCSLHNVGMRWNDGKDGRKGWFSHKDPEGRWCKGRTSR